MDKVIEIKNLCKTYGDKVILKEVSFSVEPGEITAFIGRNGAGKSTTFRLLLGLDHSSNGSATFDGKGYSELKNPLCIVGASFDGVGGDLKRSVYRHLKIVALSNGIKSSRIDTVLSLVNMEHKRNANIGSLSLGEGQRIAIAQALLGDPQYLLMDEPTNGLDIDGVKWFRKFIKEQAKLNKTILISSHNFNELEGLCDKAVIINKGKIIFKGDMGSLINKNKSLENVFDEMVGGNE